MAKRRKNRTHLKGAGGTAVAAAAIPGSDGTPKTFIVKHGAVGSSISQLVRDTRKLMEPNTASRLRERKRNKLKDFLVLAPSLGVTHLLAFTLTPLAPSLRIIRLSAGPTLSFRIERYSLTKDLQNTSRRSKSVGMEYLSPPLLVLASFPPPGSPDHQAHLPLIMKTFQSLFPPLAPTKISLSSARRVVLVSYNASKGTIELRHYLISVRAVGISRRVRKVLEGGGTHASSKQSASGDLSKENIRSLDLSNQKDVADYLLGSRGKDGEDGYETAGSTSAASEVDGEDTSVRLAGDYTGRNNRRGEKRAIRLDEIGPRLELKLIKITEGVPGKEGSVLYHEFVKKDASEIAELKKAATERERLRKARRAEQERNVERKKKPKDASSKKGAQGDDADDDASEDRESGNDDDEAGENEDEDEDAWEDEDVEIDEGSEAEESDASEDEMPPPSAKRSRQKK